MAQKTQKPRFPEWLRRRYRPGGDLARVESLLKDLSLHTVCQGAHCPNCGECFGRGTATFLILGDTCTRSCRFCAIPTSKRPASPDPDEPERIAQAVQTLGLRYVVITSVTRDDLPLGGAEQFAACIREIRALDPSIRIEVLVPDFQGNRKALEVVFSAGPDVFNHNLETVPDLYPQVRPQADYNRSLEVIRYAHEYSQSGAALPLKEEEKMSGTAAPGCDSSSVSGSFLTKSGIMVGLGETDGQVYALMDDLRSVGCDMITIGQYLAPSPAHHPVVEYIHPDIFERYAQAARTKGFLQVASSPFVRSSYQAEQFFPTNNQTPQQ